METWLKLTLVGQMSLGQKDLTTKQVSPLIIENVWQHSSHGYIKHGVDQIIFDEIT
jgi:hypothetical protein